MAGTYQVVYRVSVNNPAGFGSIQRLVMQTVYVRPSALDLGASVMSSSVNDNTIVWNFKPVRIDGRLWGPAQAGALAVHGAGVRVIDIADDQFGGYTITLEGDPDSDVKITLLGEKVYSGPASGFGADRFGSLNERPRWQLWLLALLILVVLIWALKKLF